MVLRLQDNKGTDTKARKNTGLLHFLPLGFEDLGQFVHFLTGPSNFLHIATLLFIVFHPLAFLWTTGNTQENKQTRVSRRSNQ
jgi:hypothetical protein